MRDIRRKKKTSDLLPLAFCSKYWKNVCKISLTVDTWFLSAPQKRRRSFAKNKCYKVRPLRDRNNDLHLLCSQQHQLDALTFPYSRQISMVKEDHLALTHMSTEKAQ